MNSKYFFVGMLIVVCAMLFVGCAGKTPIDIQDNIMSIGGCTIATSGCVVTNCGDYITNCANKKCDVLGLSLCLVTQCSDEAKTCIDEIEEVIKNE